MTMNQIFFDALAIYGISMDEVHGKASNGTLKWFKYLTTFFIPTLPVWSNLLLGIIFYLILDIVVKWFTHLKVS